MYRLNRLVWMTWLVVGVVGSEVARAQATAADVFATRGPRFLLASASTAAAPTRIDVSRTPALRRRLSLDLEGATLNDALTAIKQKSGLQLIYTSAVVPLDRPVHLKADDITVAAALTEVLLDADVDVLFSTSGKAVLVARAKVAAANGSITGRVTDAKTQAVLTGATVVVQGTSHSATTGSDGRYRIAGVAPGTYTVRARYIGYAPGAASVTVSADQETTADFTLEKSAQRLDEVVTTGTVTPTEVKALPTPVSVIDDSTIALQRPHSVQELFRQAIPTFTSPDYAAYPSETSFSVRGTSGLSPGAGKMKVFVDGIEQASYSFAAVDPASIERVEVIRGPQAAAIYGSDAIGGVIQIFTKRGDPTLTRPQVDAEAAVGVIQTPYAGYGGVLRQSYKASVSGGASVVSYNFGGSYSRTGDYIPNGEISRQSDPSVFGGMHFARGMVTADLSGRYYVQNDPQLFNPDLFQTGDVSYRKPDYQPTQYQNQTLGARFGLAPSRWWDNNLTVGIDRYSVDLTQTQPRLTTPADTLLSLFNQSNIKVLLGYNASVHGALAAGVSGSLTAGVDHYSITVNQWSTDNALNASGTIRLPSGQSFTLSHNTTTNTGYFAQAQLGFRDVLFLTGGLRAEHNSNFGDSLGIPLSPRVGLSYVQSMRGATFKLRGSWGRAIKPPTPGLKFATTLGQVVTLANPNLGPERQHGWDAGVDAVFGGHGSLSVTYFDQAADNLIQIVRLQASPVRIQQWQNVAGVKNTGVEVEGTVNAGLLQLRGQYGYARARVEQLAPTYTGDLRVGDQTFLTPKHTAGASLAVAPLPGTTVAAGLTYVGSATYYDGVAESRCFGGTGPCQPGPGLRNYLISYPGFVKVNATVSQTITRLLSGFVSIDNLANNQAFEAGNFGPVMGRITTVGLHVRY